MATFTTGNVMLPVLVELGPDRQWHAMIIVPSSYASGAASTVTAAGPDRDSAGINLITALIRKVQRRHRRDRLSAPAA